MGQKWANYVILFADVSSAPMDNQGRYLEVEEARFFFVYVCLFYLSVCLYGARGSSHEVEPFPFPFPSSSPIHSLLNFSFLSDLVFSIHYHLTPSRFDFHKSP